MEELPIDEYNELSEQANEYYKRGNYAQAIIIGEKILTLARQLWGDYHTDIADSLNNLALNYKLQGHYRKAESLYVETLEITKRLLGIEHLDMAVSLNNLAALYKSQGRYNEAEKLDREALDIYKEILGFKHPIVAISLSNLGLLCRFQKRYIEAEFLYLQALAIRKDCFGYEHPDVASSLNHLANLYHYQDKYDEAESLYLEALTIRKGILGNEHPSIANSLNNLAALYSHQGKYDEAEQQFVEALEMRKRLFGAKHPDVASSLNNLAGLFAATYRSLKALDNITQATEIDNEIIRRVFAFSSDSDRLNYIDTIRSHLDGFFSLVYSYLSDTPQGLQAALDLIFQRKALTASALAAQNEALYSDRYPHLTKDFQKLRDLSEQITHLTFLIPQTENFITYEQQLAQLQAEHNNLQKTLASQVPEIKLQEQLPNCSDVASELPAGSVLIEFVRFDVFNFKAIPALGEAQRQPARYLAFILPAGDPESVEMVDIGEAEYIDSLIREFRELVSGAGKNPESQLGMFGKRPPKLIFREYHPQAGIKLRQAIFDKLRPALKEHQHLVIAPDGELNLVPFQILPSDDTGEKMLVENPMLRSALALAGANTWAKGGKLPPEAGKGILFAQDVAGLDLWANEITVLSACETGIGDVAIGEGVFGLRRAFTVAGAKTLIMSLWSVNGWATTLLMERFFDNCKAGLGRADALQEAQNYLRNITVQELNQLELGPDILKHEFNNGKKLDPAILEDLTQEKPFSHPFYWGAWICQGDINPIEMLANS